jgi:ABC-2 type transport system ATP-binding protein
VLPRWMRVSQALDLLERVHPRFDRSRAEEFLARTDVMMKSKISALSKGMVTQLHLALVMAIDARLLVLDEPTLGLDILFRKEFYRVLLNDYFDGKRTIVITTHQVEEIEHLLTDLMFVNHGRLVLDSSMDDLANRYTEVMARPEKTEALRQLGPIDEQQSFGRTVMLFEDRPRESLREFGDLRTPSIADLFVAKMKASRK